MFCWGGEKFEFLQFDIFKYSLVSDDINVSDICGDMTCQLVVVFDD